MTHAESAKNDVEYGFWLYLMSDAVLFGLIFATFAVLSGNTDGGPSGADLFDLKTLSMETAFLLISTLTMAFAHSAARQGEQRLVVRWLLVTVLLGLGFLGLEIYELTGFVSDGAGPARSGFLSGVFVLVGTHGLHVTAGVIWALTLMVHVSLRGCTPRVTSQLSRLTLFWHFLDIVWVGVFSVIYLPGIAT
jgi:cytochrome o ubiquinol oxidase subunit 3